MEIKEKYTIDDLIGLMEFLRSDQGCPWDREQTHDSIKHNAVEEAYEVVDAITSEGPERLADELGDLLLQVVFHSQMAKEKDQFDFDDVIKNICVKLISRHTHLFSDQPEQVKSAEEVLVLWDKNKKKEKKQSTQTQAMKEVSRVLPALVRTQKIQKKASQVGFDWQDPQEVMAKIDEEVLEVREAAATADPIIRKVRLEDELGDLIFAVVNYARFAGVDAETALDQANRKFIRRFEKVENEFLSGGREMQQASLREMDEIWDRVKSEE